MFSIKICYPRFSKLFLTSLEKQIPFMIGSHVKHLATINIDNYCKLNIQASF